MDKCTLVICSCDTYDDTWLPFFKILKDRWPDRPYPIVLNTESKEFNYDDMKIKTFSLYPPPKKVNWGKRLIETLENIKTEYVLILLDDFFLEKTVNQNEIDKCIQWMDDNKNIAVFSFMPTKGENIRDNKYEFFEKRPQNGEYRLNCQAAVWRREYLIKYTRPHENPWEWELNGSKRSSRYTEEFYSLIEGSPLVFDYDLIHGGAVHRGRWVREVLNKITKTIEVDIDYSKRGFEDDYLKLNIPHKRNLFRGIKNRISKIRSLI